MRRAVLALLALLTLAGTLALVGPADAHDELVHATPAGGATLAHLPATATLVFSEPVRSADVDVKVGPRRLAVRPVEGRPAAVRVDLHPLRTGHPVGSLRLSWRAVDDEDGHVTTGELTFHLRAGAADDAAGRSPPKPPIDWRTALVRGVGYLATAFFVGALGFLAFLWPRGAGQRRARRLLAATLVLGVASSLGQVWSVVHGAGGALSVRQVLDQDFGRVDVAQALLWALAVVVVVGVLQGGETAVRRLAWRVGAMLVAAGLIRTTGMTAHGAQTATPVWGEVADFLHLCAVSAWVGGLLVLSLCVLPGGRPDELADVVRRFSRVALGSVLVVASTGVVLGWRIAGSAPGFWDTRYVLVHGAKVAVFGLVLLAAMRSKHLVDRRLGRPAPGDPAPAGVRALAVSVGAESLLVVVVLGIASVRATSSPGV
jgi:putative copper export protein/methionine-rich copper-binding protein CopC